VARSGAAAREQIEASQAVRNKSFIPLSKAGIQLGSSAEVRRVQLLCVAQLRALCAWCLCSEFFLSVLAMLGKPAAACNQSACLTTAVLHDLQNSMLLLLLLLAVVLLVRRRVCAQ
jgi:hypothetical protein